MDILWNSELMMNYWGWSLSPGPSLWRFFKWSYELLSTY